MSVFGSIMSKIFGRSQAAEPAAPAGATPGGPPGGAPAPTGQAGMQSGGAGTGPQAAPVGTAATAGTGAMPMPAVDVKAVLTDLASKNPQKLNWDQSIVDLMKLLNLDSGLENRKELAQELHYTGDTGDSAAMNVWLHKQVMRKLAENGGVVPADLKD